MLDRLRRIPVLDRPVFAWVLVAAIALAFGLPLVKRAIILSDEGYLLQQALDLLGGRVLYRDMDAFITPGAWFLLAGAFAVFGPSVIVSRYVILVVYVATALTAWRIVAPVSGRLAGAAAVAALLLFSVWAFPAWTFAFYSPMAVLLALMGLERLLAYQRGGRSRDLALVGVLLGLSICFKQNYGVFALVGAAIAHFASRWRAGAPVGEAFTGISREVGLVAGGVVAAGLPFLAYLVANGALGDAWYSLVVHPFEFGGRHDIPYAPLSDLWKPDVYSGAVEKLTYLSYASLRAGPIAPLQEIRGTHRLHALAYWIPPLVFLAGLALAFVAGRRQGRLVDAPLFTVVATCGTLFLGVLPRADFNHLVNVYQPVLVATAVVVQRAWALLPGRAPARRVALFASVGLVAFLYGSIAVVWYGALVRQHDAPIDSPRAGVLVGRLEADEIDHQLGAIRRHSSPGSALLTVPDLTMLNFLAERAVPSAYYNLYEHHIASDGGAAVAAGAEAAGVDLAITRYDNFFSDRVGLLDYAPKLVDYMATRFEREFVGADQDYIVYRRRESPEVAIPYADALADCRSTHALADVGRHLLFSSLFHRSRPLAPMPEDGLETICRVRVPEHGGFLSLELGYHRPEASQMATRLVSEIRVESAAGSERIHREWLRVLPRRGALREQPFKRADIDLSRFAGQEIDLVFATRLEGNVATLPHNWKGFAMVYRDPRIQAAPGGARP